jgi:hypothetical protein
MQGTFKSSSPAVNGSGTVFSECYLYANWGLPEQKELGIIKGKCKADIERVITIHNSNGHYGIVLDENGVPLVSTDKIGGKISADLVALKAENKKRLNWCEDSTNTVDSIWEDNDWVGNGGTYAEESTLVNNGLLSAKMTADTDIYGIHTVFSSAKDLTVFDNGEDSISADYIGFSIYIAAQDLTDLNAAALRLYFHNDDEGTLTNGYYKDIAVGDLVADSWNNFLIAKSSFTQVGSGAWTGVKGISLVIAGSPSAEVIAYIDAISLIQAETQSEILPVNGGYGITCTDEDTYYKLIGRINIENDEYYENVAIITSTHDGLPIVIVFENSLIVNDIELSMPGNREDVVTPMEFIPHYGDTKEDEVPIKFYFYTSGTVAEVIS